jgi:hypothetical protein
LRIICERYTDIREKLTNIQVNGRGNHSNSKGCDLPTLIEIMMLSPTAFVLQRELIMVLVLDMANIKGSAYSEKSNFLVNPPGYEGYHAVLDQGI